MHFLPFVTCSQPLLETQREFEMKPMEEQGIGACSLACSTLGVKGRVGALGWDQEE
jgi:hypothetical protein